VTRDDEIMAVYAARCWETNLMVDAQECGNHFRFLQYSHHPTVDMQNVQVSGKTGFVAGVVSNSFFPAGTPIELSVIYSEWPSHPKFLDVCLCPSPKCTGFQCIRVSSSTATDICASSPYFLISSLLPCSSPVSFILYFKKSSPFSDSPTTSTSKFYGKVKVTTHTPPTHPNMLPHYALIEGHYYYLDTSHLSNIIKNARKGTALRSQLNTHTNTHTQHTDSLTHTHPHLHIHTHT